LVRTPSRSYLASYSYDLAGRRIGVGDNSAAIIAPATTGTFSTSYTYDPLNRAVSVAWSPAPAQAAPAATGVTFTHAYDPTNRRIRQSASDNSWLL
jgi:hypothetical protein